MDHTDLELVLKTFESENEAIQRQIAALQDRSAALARGAEGVRALLEAMPEPVPRAASVAPPAIPTAPMGDAPKAGRRTSRPRRARSRRKGKPKGMDAAKLILESDPSRFWTVRDVHDEEVRLGLTEYRPPGTRGNPPARSALERLQKEYPENVEVQKTPLAYKWTSQPILPSVNGSGIAGSEEASS